MTLRSRTQWAKLSNNCHTHKKSIGLMVFPLNICYYISNRFINAEKDTLPY